jgi:RNA polymerase sigma-70 factor, ECF subfamily
MAVVGDSELVEQATQGRFEAFEALVERYQHRVYGLAKRLLRDEHEAADVAQETFLAVWQHLDEYRPPEANGVGTDASPTPLQAWILTIAANASLGRLRKRKVRQTHEAPRLRAEAKGESLVEAVPDLAPSAETTVLTEELRRAIESAAQSLSAEFREVFLLRDIEGFSYEDVAQTTGLTLANVKTRLHRARLAMRAALVNFYEEKVA